MSEAARKARVEAAEKATIIEGDIILPLESLDRELRNEQRAGLKKMTKEELRQLAKRLKASTSGHDAMRMIVHAIHASKDAKRKAEEEMQASFGPATVSMNL